jgi:hypothetical protein
MVTAKDFLLDKDGDLTFTKDGDFAVGASDATHITHILEAYVGWYRESILTGLGILDYLHSAGAGAELKRNAQLQLEADNYKLTTIKVSKELELEINAERIR